MTFLATWGLSTGFIYNRKLTEVHWSIIMFVYALISMVVGASYFTGESLLYGVFTIKSAWLYGLLSVTAIADFAQNIC